MFKKLFRRFTSNEDLHVLEAAIKHLNTRLDMINIKFIEWEKKSAENQILIEDVEDRTHKNLAKLNNMLCEFKGLVAMSRASLPKREPKDKSKDGDFT